MTKRVVLRRLGGTQVRDRLAREFRLSPAIVSAALRELMLTVGARLSDDLRSSLHKWADEAQDLPRKAGTFPCTAEGIQTAVIRRGVPQHCSAQFVSRSIGTMKDHLVVEMRRLVPELDVVRREAVQAARRTGEFMATSRA